MSPKVLRRCTVCKRFHASYLVEDAAFGKSYLCYDCWKARQPVPDAGEKVGPEPAPTESGGQDPQVK